jgi:hypothetical protein
MEPPPRLSHLFTRLVEAAKGLAGKLKREKPPPAMISAAA